MSQQKTLLFVVNKASFFLSHRLLLARGALSQGYRVHVATPMDNDVEKITENNFVHHSILMNRSGSNPFQELRSLYSLYTLYKELKPDLIHHITIKPVLYGSIAARLAKVPAIVNAIPGLGHVFTETGFVAAIRKKIVIIVYRAALKHKNMEVIFQNTENYNFFIGKRLVNKTNAVVIKGSGVDVNEYYPEPEPSQGLPLVILASRMLYDKGVSQFVDAARLINSDKMVARFALIGDSDSGNPNSVPVPVLTSWHTEGYIEWWGHRDNMPEVIRMSNIVCLPTYYGEGVPKVLIEAAASGRPIVATDIAGCREIVQNGENGILVMEKSVPDLVKAIRKLIENTGLREKMSQAGRKLVMECFSSDTVIADTISVYRDLH
ncbi:MAG TPA: glycosyltransferase family 1 protein [Gammaproteobacteria bacterium]|mgnify:CR=1 FL=1|nr:glycosyltransferase family 1 protein [Gammaproteobacteria bacterium]